MLAAAREEAGVGIELADRLAQARGGDLDGHPALGDGRGRLLVARLDDLGRGRRPKIFTRSGCASTSASPLRASAPSSAK